MRALILVAGAALALAAPAIAGPRHHREEERDHDRYESPYSNEAMARERDRKELARDIAKAERDERQKERAYAPRHDPDDSDGDDEDDPDAD